MPDLGFGSIASFVQVSNLTFALLYVACIQPVPVKKKRQLQLENVRWCLLKNHHPAPALHAALVSP